MTSARSWAVGSSLSGWKRRTLGSARHWRRAEWGATCPAMPSFLLVMIGGAIGQGVAQDPRERRRHVVVLEGDVYGKLLLVLRHGDVVQVLQQGPLEAVELLEAATPDSPIARFVDRRGPGLHHVCFAVDDLEEATDHGLARDGGDAHGRELAGLHQDDVARLHLGAGVTGLGTLGKNVQNEIGSIQNFALQNSFYIFLLCRGKFIVKNDSSNFIFLSVL